ncbi:MAG: squalene synthase HpnC [Gaiellaceae bacterium]
MPKRVPLAAPELAVARIDARARGENFPVASFLAPAWARPHLRAIYGFARLVDTLGDEAPGDRLALLDELERELDGPPETEVMRRLHTTIEARALPLEPFRRLIEANRIDQRQTRYETWEEVREYCTYSADPVGRLVLGVYGRLDEPELMELSDAVCTGLQLVNFLQDPPRDLALGRVYLPQEDLRRFAVREEELAGPGSERFRSLAQFESDRARLLLERGFPLARALGGRPGRSVALFARGGLAALETLERADYDVFTRRPSPSAFALGRLALEELSSPSETATAYAQVLRITRREAQSFAWGIRVLPRPKRRAVAALYAFARRVDDIADDASLAADERRSRLESCRAAAERLPESRDGDLVLVALADAVARYGIPRQALIDLVDGGLMDVGRVRYETWEELREYCRRVAGAVGVACAAFYGPSEHDEAMGYAETLGLALQQINIIRDVGEDWRLGRVYLPQDELERFGVTEADIEAGRTSPEWRSLMEHQAVRAEQLLGEGLKLLGHLDRRSALGVRSFAGTYRALLEQMRVSGYEVFDVPPRLSAAEKVRAVVSR